MNINRIGNILSTYLTIYLGSFNSVLKLNKERDNTKEIVFVY